LKLATNPIWPPALVAAAARRITRLIASRFIVSGGLGGAVNALHYLQARRRYPSFDVLGEYVASEREADRYRDHLDLLPGMAYLVRRILENSSQAGFLLHSRSGEPVETLLAPPGPHPGTED
ncbi:MAG TPA: hypothetical protein VK821_20485, partial [Dehalococcoidia bacterium]|nr:hypothetical protein [Dehalococcoidia bacterium]